MERMNWTSSSTINHQFAQCLMIAIFSSIFRECSIRRGSHTLTHSLTPADNGNADGDVTYFIPSCWVQNDTIKLMRIQNITVIWRFAGLCFSFFSIHLKHILRQFFFRSFAWVDKNRTRRRRRRITWRSSSTFCKLTWIFNYSFFDLSPLNDTTQTPKWKTNKQNRRVTKGKCSSLSTINTHTNSNTVCHVSIKIQLNFENRLEWRFSNDVLDFLAMMMMSNSIHNGKQNKIEAKPKQSRRDCYWCLLFVCCAIEPWSISSAHLKGKCFSWMCKLFGFEF